VRIFEKPTKLPEPSHSGAPHRGDAVEGIGPDVQVRGVDQIAKAVAGAKTVATHIANAVKRATDCGALDGNTRALRRRNQEAGSPTAQRDRLAPPPHEVDETDPKRARPLVTSQPSAKRKADDVFDEGLPYW